MGKAIFPATLWSAAKWSCFNFFLRCYFVCAGIGNDLRERSLWDQTQAFARMVRQSKGRILLMVHPLYLPPDEAYSRTLARMTGRAKVPVVVFDDGTRSAALNALSGLNPFYVETLPEDPKPSKGWVELHNVFQAAGVRHILLAGMKSTVPFQSVVPPRDAEQFSMRLRGCVGEAYSKLVRIGEYRITFVPSLLFPDRPPRRLRPKA